MAAVLGRGLSVQSHPLSSGVGGNGGAGGDGRRPGHGVKPHRKRTVPSAFATHLGGPVADRPPPALALLISDVKTVAQLRQIVIGAIKRASEMVILTLTWHHPATKSIAMHFGNVMSSNGSLIPKFKKHPLEGGQPF